MKYILLKLNLSQDSQSSYNVLTVLAL